jgi:hypothetical protein
VSEISPDDLRSLLLENAALAEKLEAAEARLEQSPPLLAAADVAALVDDLLARLDSQLAGLAVRDGELRLNVGFEQVGEERRFVVPSSAAPPEARENLHSVSLRFVREAE